MALAIAEQQPTCLRKRHAMAQGGQRILQHTAALHVHVHVTAGHGRESRHLRQGKTLCQYPGIVAVAVQLHRQPGMQKSLADPAGPFQQGMHAGIHDRHGARLSGHQGCSQVTCCCCRQSLIFRRRDSVVCCPTVVWRGRTCLRVTRIHTRSACIGCLSVGVLIRQPEAEQAIARSPFHIRP